MFTSIENAAVIIIFIILTVSCIIQFMYWIIKKNNDHGIYLLIILFIALFIFSFIWYNERAFDTYEEVLNKIEKMYTNQHNTISNHNEINKRILFLEERIAHYQNNSNNFASLWLTLLSVLFITVTGFNLYNYNESKKKLEEIIEKGEESIKKIDSKIKEIDIKDAETAYRTDTDSTNNLGKIDAKGGDNV